MASQSYERPPTPDDLHRNIIAGGPGRVDQQGMFGPPAMPIPDGKGGFWMPMPEVPPGLPMMPEGKNAPPPPIYEGPSISQEMAEEMGWLFPPSPGPQEWKTEEDEERSLW